MRFSCLLPGLIWLSLLGSPAQTAAPSLEKAATLPAAADAGDAAAARKSAEAEANAAQVAEAGVKALGTTTGVVKEVWRKGVHPTLSVFEFLAGWRTPPDESSTLPGFSFEEDTPGPAVFKLSAWFEPEFSGDYVFWMASRGPARLTVSQPDSVSPMATGQFVYTGARTGWPKPGQWDLTKRQRCGPWPMEKGRRYLLEFWTSGHSGVKHGSLAWSASEKGPIKDWALAVRPVPGRLMPSGEFQPQAVPLPDQRTGEAQPGPKREGPEESPAPALAGSPKPDAKPKAVPLTAPSQPGEGLLLRWQDEAVVQRITVGHPPGPGTEKKPAQVTSKIMALDSEDNLLASTTFRPGRDPLATRFEWLLPGPLPVAGLVVALAVDSEVPETAAEPLLLTVEAWGPAEGGAPLTPRALLAGRSLYASKAGPSDINGNALGDAWEARFPQLVGKSAPSIPAAGDDPDQDGLLNQLESNVGRNPLVPEQVGLRFTLEYWRNVHETEVSGLTAGSAFYGPPDLRVVRSLQSAAPIPARTGMRLRGYLTAPTHRGLPVLDLRQKVRSTLDFGRRYQVP